MPIKSETIEVGKSYMARNGAHRKVFEIVPRNRKRPTDPSDDDIIKFEEARSSYDTSTPGAPKRKKTQKTVRDKQIRRDFAKDVTRELD